MKKFHITLIAALLVLTLGACGQKTETLTGADRAAVLAFSEAQTDNLLAGLNAGDYAIFSRDFDADMLKAIPESEFNKLKGDRDSKLGSYISRTVDSVYKQGDFYAVVYIAKFEKESAVTVRVVFRIAEPHQVSGLWFDK
jgi:hypothetical protein